MLLRAYLSFCHAACRISRFRTCITGQVADFTSIQAAVDNAFPGDIIFISPGIYEENIDIYVTNLTLVSEPGNPADTIVQAVNSLDNIFHIIADEVTISGLNITGPVNFSNAGIRLNTASGNSYGVCDSAFPV